MSTDKKYDDEDSDKHLEEASSPEEGQSSFLELLRAKIPSPMPRPQPKESDAAKMFREAATNPYSNPTFLREIEESRRPPPVNHPSFKGRSSFPLHEAGEIIGYPIDAILERAQFGFIELVILTGKQIDFHQIVRPPNQANPCFNSKERKLKQIPDFLILKEQNISELRTKECICVDEFSGGYFLKDPESITPLGYIDFFDNPDWFNGDLSWITWTSGTCTHRQPISISRSSIFILAKDMFLLSGKSKRSILSEKDDNNHNTIKKQPHGNAKLAADRRELVIKMALSFQKNHPDKCTSYSAWSSEIVDHWFSLVKEHDKSGLFQANKASLQLRTITKYLSKEKLLLTSRNKK